MGSLTLGTETLALRDGSLPRIDWYDLGRIAREAVFDWDRVVKGTHLVNCWYNSHCSYNVYVKDGIALREEQPHHYPVPNDPDCPDFNPKGCNKGCAGVHRLYDPSRLRYPLKRVGARGEGKWKRVSWDEALDDIGATMLDVLVTDGPSALHLGAGSQSGSFRWDRTFWSRNVGAPSPDVNGEIGDDHQGAYEFTGKIGFGHSADDLFYADLVCIWGGNPSYTGITLYHYIVEARYRGARVVTVSADYNPSAMPADLWITVRPGSDAALALSMCQVILEEGLFKEAFFKEQTDLPLLVRTDNHKYLRETDLKRKGRDYVYYFWDAAADRLAEAPHQTLVLGAARPALEGEWEVKTRKGKVRVRPVFAMFKEKLFASYRPEQASQVCGVGPDLIRRFAREFATARGVVNISQSCFSKYYHGNLMERACLYLWALCGHMGRRGANYVAFAGIWIVDMTIGALEPSYFKDMPRKLVNHPRYAEWRTRGFSDKRMVREAFADMVAAAGVTFTSLFYYFHGGLLELSKEHNSWDPHLRRPLQAYVDEGLAKGLKPVVPGPEQDPKVFLAWAGNPLRRRGTQHMLRTLLPKLRLLVSVDWRWNTSASYSDYVLPAASWYEHPSMSTFSPVYSPWLTYSGKAVEPPGEARSDWWIWTRLFASIAKKARERGVGTITDPKRGTQVRVESLDHQFTGGGLYTAEDEAKVVRDAVSSAVNIDVREEGWDRLVERGYTLFTDPGYFPSSTESGGEIKKGEPFVPNTDHVEKKEPWPTATGRMQFYIDHDWYLELGEEFAWHKDSVRSGGDYPLQMTGGHARWTIHTAWSDSPLLLRLQRGVPVLFMSRPDADRRGVRDGDRVEAYNDLGKFEIQAVVSPAVRPGQVIVYHGWENYQYKDWRQHREVVGSPFNPVEFAPAGAEYPNIRARPLVGYPGNNDRDSRVEVRRIDAGREERAP